MEAEKSNLQANQVQTVDERSSSYSQSDRTKLVQLFELLIEMDKTIKEKESLNKTG